jgi:hypothetical protein
MINTIARQTLDQACYVTNMVDDVVLLSYCAYYQKAVSATSLLDLSKGMSRGCYDLVHMLESDQNRGQIVSL